MKKYDIRSILSYCGIEGKERKGELITNCVFHERRLGKKDKNPSLGINLDSGLYNCWSCGASGNIYKFVVEFGIVEAEHVGDFLEHFLLLDTGSGVGDIVADVNLALLEVEDKREFKLEAYKKGYYHPYFKTRKIKRATVDVFEAGYNSRLKRIVFPIINMKGEHVALVGRSIKDEFPPYLYTKNAPLDEMLFGLNTFKPSPDGTVILVEGILDLAWVWQVGFKNTLSTFMAKFHEAQVDLLLRLGAKNLILFFDNDMPGKTQTSKVIEMCIKHWSNILCVTRYCGLKDPQKMSSKQVVKALKNTQTYIDFYLEGGGSELYGDYYSPDDKKFKKGR